MARKTKYTFQIGTPFDKGQELIWTLIAHPSLYDANTIIPRPRSYRKQLAAWANVDQFDASMTTGDGLNDILPLNQGDPAKDLHVFLKSTELMQPVRNFCPDGDWFFNLGELAAQYRKMLAPSELKFMISLRNPAMLLTDAWSSGSYPDFAQNPPDPFALRWAAVLRDLRDHCPDVPIVAWCAEDAAMVWKQVLNEAIHPAIDMPVAAELHIANRWMSEEGSARLKEFLEQKTNLTSNQRARVIGVFLKTFALKSVLDQPVDLPGWDHEKDESMEEHYAADLIEVAKIDGVTLLKV